MVTTNRHQKEAQRLDAIQQARHQWMADRIANIHQSVTAFDVMLRNGVDISGGREEQFSCPFHGIDRRPSARIYPESPTSPSHAWCFKCQERWDAIALWKKFNSMEEMPFGQVLGQIEKAFSLEVPPFPEDGVPPSEPQEDTDLLEYEMLRDVCERRLKDSRSAYRKVDDMVGFLSASAILDKLSFRVQKKTLRPDKALGILRQVLDRIGAKVRSVPVDESWLEG